MITLTITTQEGEVFDVEVTHYDAVETNAKLNDSEVNTVVIGDNIYGRFDIKRIIKKD